MRAGEASGLLALLKERSSGSLPCAPPRSPRIRSRFRRPGLGDHGGGINGVGKTTSIGKLAHQYVRTGHRVMIAAADTFRAAANEQIGVWAERAGASLIQQKHGADPAAVAFDAVHAAASRGADVVIIDTAGRLHTKVNLMESSGRSGA